MFEFHADRKRYFDIQALKLIQNIFFLLLNPILQSKEGMRVLEIGCGEGGVLKPFLE